MRSSISSSEHGWRLRETPAKPWLPVLVAAVVVVTAALFAWEVRVRADGFAPTYNDTPNLWASRRELARNVGPEQIVFVGSSRTLFDMDLEVFANATGGPLPLQLATVGSNPLAILGDLAADPSYAGTTIVGIVPSLIAATAGPPVSTPQKFVDHYHHWSPADRVELVLALALQDRLAFINPDLTLAALLEEALALPNREDAYAPEIPGYGYTLDRTRRARMIPALVDDPHKREATQQIWIPLFTPPPKPAVFSDEQWAAMQAAGWERNLARLKADVAAIQARGGRVIFSRLPSSGTLREMENRYTPRAKFWDRIVNETGAPGVHFEDHAELRGFECPEWSHLSQADSVEYSRRLVAVMHGRGLL